MAGKYPGVQKAYDRDGFGGVWRFAKGHGRKRWLKARNWARRRIRRVKDPAGFKKAEAAYQKKLDYFAAHEHPKPPSSGGNWITFDGRTCCGWIAGILTRARASGIWHGSVISGVRTPEYSEQLCYAMCGAPSCSGRCAGRASNHNATTCAYPQGAVDVTDYNGLEAYCRSHGEKLYGGGYALPQDYPHFSASGR